MIEFVIRYWFPTVWLVSGLVSVVIYRIILDHENEEMTIKNAGSICMFILFGGISFIITLFLYAKIVHEDKKMINRWIDE